MDKTVLSTPFRINDLGQVANTTGDTAIREKILQVLLTAPGERVNLPEFGCGLRDLVFDPNNEILAATTEYTIAKSLERWVGQDIVVEGVDVKSDEEVVHIAVKFIRKDSMERNTVKIAF